MAYGLIAIQEALGLDGAGKRIKTQTIVENDLFSTSTFNQDPLAERLRPMNFDEVLGQSHLVNNRSLLRKSIEQDSLSSIVLYGPPGTGKTTIASIIARYTKRNFHKLNAVFSNIQNLRDIIKDAKDQLAYYQKRTIVFIDEIHRWNKAQQEALLPWLENGLITLIGATTQNPFFELTKALLSRLQVFELYPLSTDDLAKAIDTALSDSKRGYGETNVTIDNDAKFYLAEKANGDVRVVYNAIEWLFSTYNLHNSIITTEMAKEALQKKALLYDRDGDFHYDSVSAFIKSIRGSDPDAALFWASVMLKGGEDPSFIFRRLMISAAEDIGLADPQAIQVVTSCASAFDRVGMPEGLYFISEAILYCATSPKSNSAGAIFSAQTLVETEQFEVPMDLRDSSRDGDALGHGSGYEYPHTTFGHWIPHSYLPSPFMNKFMYKPGVMGFEKKRFEASMLRHTSILTACDMRITHSDAAGMTNAYLGLQRTLRSIMPNAHQLIIEHSQGALFSRMFSITDADKKHKIAAPLQLQNVLQEIYFRDFEQALMPSFQFFELPLLLTQDTTKLPTLFNDFFSLENSLVFYCKAKPSLEILTVINKIFPLCSECFCVVPVLHQQGLIPRIMQSLLDQKHHDALLALDFKYFEEQKALLSTSFPETFYHHVCEYSAPVERIIEPATMQEWFNADSEYGQYLSKKTDLSVFQTALSDLKNPVTVSWTYAWKLIKTRHT